MINGLSVMRLFSYEPMYQLLDQYQPEAKPTLKLDIWADKCQQQVLSWSL